MATWSDFAEKAERPDHEATDAMVAYQVGKHGEVSTVGFLVGVYGLPLCLATKWVARVTAKGGA
jgi:hypothetical protein